MREMIKKKTDAQMVVVVLLSGRQVNEDINDMAMDMWELLYQGQGGRLVRSR